MNYAGDFAAGGMVDFKFTTRRFSTGAPHQLAGSPAVSVYKSNSTTQSTTGVTLTVDFDSVTGLNHVRIDTSADGTFYADGSQFDVVITAGTVDSVSVVGEVVGRFTLRAQASLYPTTAGRTLDVSAGGEAGLDWANVGTPGSTVNLSATTVGVVTDLADGSINAAALSSDTITAAKIATGAITAAKFAAGAIDAAAIATDAIDADALADGAITAATFAAGAIDANAITSAKIATDAIGAAQIAADAIGSSELAASAVTEIQSGLSTLDAAGVRSAVGLASANLDTQLSAISGFIDTEVASILSAVDTEVAAIKAKTDNLPATPAATGDAMTLTSGERNSVADAMLTRQMTEAYNADGAAPTVAQAFFVIMQRLTDFAISGTTITVRKIDGSTAAYTLTIDSSTTPTSSTRAT